MLHGLALRRAILETLQAYQQQAHETPLRDLDLAKRLQVELERLDAHFVYLERGKYVSFLAMPGPSGERLRYVTVTPAGETLLTNPKNFESTKPDQGPFKVVEKEKERIVEDVGEIRAMIDRSDWVLDEEKPEILAKLDDLEAALAADRWDPADVGELKLYFEKYKWLAPHVSAAIRKRLGF